MSVLDKFTVVDLIKTRSASVATIAGNILKFNNQTAAELNFAPFIQVLVNPKDKQFAIRACKEDAPNALPFSKPEGEQKYPIKISTAVVTDLIRKMAGWAVEDNWNVPGIYFADELALIYDVSAAYKPAAKGGWASKRQHEAASKAAMESLGDDGGENTES